jgi:hypothetical protein
MEQPRRRPYQLHFFTLRLWQEALDAEQYEWRGEVKNTTTGELRYFRDALSLYSTLLVMLDGPPSPIDEDGASDG